MSDENWEDVVVDEIDRLHEQADEAAFVRFVELSDIGKENSNEALQIIGLMNAAAIACKMGNYELCLAVIDSANKINEDICTNYMQEQPRMYEMMKTLSEAGVFNN
jgi:urease accessory protein UreH